MTTDTLPGYIPVNYDGDYICCVGACTGKECPNGKHHLAPNRQCREGDVQKILSAPDFAAEEDFFDNSVILELPYLYRSFEAVMAGR